jgi:hypothetical protein
MGSFTHCWLGSEGNKAFAKVASNDFVVVIYLFNRLLTWPTDQPRHATELSVKLSKPFQAQKLKYFTF